MDFHGQAAIITGGARGIGKAIAENLAKKGADIVIGDVNLSEAQDTSTKLGSFGIRAMAVKLDVTSEEDVKKVFSETVAELGKIDILVNNAGITKDSLMLRMKEEDWDRVIEVNLKSVFLMSREAVKYMSKQRYGRIINISSVVAFIGNPGQVNYCASKAGIIGLTRTIAKEYASRGITVNAVAPGFISTAMTDALPENIKEQMKKNIPMERFGTSEDVANAVSFLASKEADYITGQVVHVNGGMYM